MGYKSHFLVPFFFPSLSKFLEDFNFVRIKIFLFLF